MVNASKRTTVADTDSIRQFKKFHDGNGNGNENVAKQKVFELNNGCALALDFLLPHFFASTAKQQLT